MADITTATLTSDRAPAAIHRSRTGSSMVSAGVQTLLTNVAQVVCVLASTSIVARALGPAAKGSYDLCLATSQLLVAVCGLSFGSGLTYVTAAGLGDVRLWRSTVYLLAAALGMLSGLVLLCAKAAGGLSALAPSDLGFPAWVLVCLTAAGLCATTYIRALVVGMREFSRANIGDLVKQGAFLALLPVAALAGKTMFPGVRPLVFFGANLVAVIAATYAYDVGLRAQAQGGSGKLAAAAALRFSLPGFAADLLQFVNYRFPIYCVNVDRGTAAVGLLQSSVFVAQSLWLIPTAIGAVLFPYVANAMSQGEDQSRNTAICARLALWSAIACALPLAVAAPFVIPLFFGPAFHESTAILRLLLPGVVVFAPAKVLGSYVAGIGKPHWNTWASAAGAAVTVPLTIVLSRNHGARGAAVASSLSYCCTSCVLLALFLARSSVTWREALLPGSAEYEAAAKWLAATRTRFART
jgi:O-antigen/teichoic acid export membrane protein